MFRPNHPKIKTTKYRVLTAKIQSIDSGEHTLELVRCGILLMEIVLSSRVEGWKNAVGCSDVTLTVTLTLTLTLTVGMLRASQLFKRR